MEDIIKEAKKELEAHIDGLAKLIAKTREKSPKHLNGILFFPKDQDRLKIRIYDLEEAVLGIINNFVTFVGEQANASMKQKMDMLMDGTMTIQAKPDKSDRTPALKDNSSKGFL